MLTRLWSVFESRSSCPLPICPLLSTGQFKPDWSSLYSVRRGWSEAKSGLLHCGVGVYGPQFRLLPKDRLQVCTQTHIHTCATPENKCPDRAGCLIGCLHNMLLQWEGCQMSTWCSTESFQQGSCNTYSFCFLCSFTCTWLLDYVVIKERKNLFSCVSVTNLDFFTWHSARNTAHTLQTDLSASEDIYTCPWEWARWWQPIQSAGFVPRQWQALYWIFFFLFFPVRGLTLVWSHYRKKKSRGHRVCWLYLSWCMLINRPWICIRHVPCFPWSLISWTYCTI